MIPKIIHLCWLSGDPFPSDIIHCLQTWNKQLIGYEIWLWGKAPCDINVLSDLQLVVREFDLNSTVWTHQAFTAKKYAFAADYIRLYALYNYGGIYLDADVLVYKAFDNLLALPYFIGCDQIRAFEAAVIGAKKGCKWIGQILASYKDKHFVKQDGSYDMMELPVRFHHILNDLGYKFYKVDGNDIDNGKEKKMYATINSVTTDGSNAIFVFPCDYFNGRDAVEVRPTKRSYCAHNYLGSWQKKNIKGNTDLITKVKTLMPSLILKLVYKVGQRTWARNKYSWFQIRFER